MRDRDAIGRREFVALITRSGILAALPAGALIVGSGCRDSKPSEPKGLLGLMSHSEAVRRVGERGLEATRADSSVSAQLERIFPGREGIVQTVQSSTPERLRELLLAQHRADLDSGRILRVDGWVLSETEVRLYAAVALNPPAD